MKTAIEVEYWVVTDDGELTSPGSLTDISEYVEPEFVEPMVEIKTSPCETIDELREELLARMRRVVRAARRDGKRLVPLGTPIHASPSEIPYRDCVRTELQRETIGPAFDDARYCAGTHVHFEQSNVVDQLNTLTALDPAFATVNTSSYNRGERVLECARPYLYRKGCYEAFPEQGQLWSYVDAVEEWETRLDDAYRAFRETARERGVDLAAFDAEFDPYDAVWSPVKLRKEYPTVEWRSPDVALPSAVLELTADVKSVVERADERGTEIADGRRPGSGAVTLPSSETVERTVERAMRNGLADPSVRAYLERLGIRPERYDPHANRCSANRVSRKRARTLRLEAADRLEDELLDRPARAGVRSDPPPLGHP